MNRGMIADVSRLEQRLELVGHSRGRVCQCWIVERAGDEARAGDPVWMAAADVVRHPAFDSLPTDDRELVGALARRAAERPWESWEAAR